MAAMRSAPDGRLARNAFSGTDESVPGRKPARWLAKPCVKLFKDRPMPELVVP